jgi:hypothetical protein
MEPGEKKRLSAAVVQKRFDVAQADRTPRPLGVIHQLTAKDCSGPPVKAPEYVRDHDALRFVWPVQRPDARA